MAKAHLELFHERFVKYNLDRYKDDPKMLPLFQGLTLGMVSITDITDISEPVEGSRRSTVTSVARNFKGIEQDWTPADAATTVKLYTLSNEDPLIPLPDLDALKEQTAVGVYSYLDVDGTTVKAGVVIAADVEEAGFAAAVETALKAALKYDIPEVNVPEGGTTIELIGDTFLGTLEWVQGAAEIIIIPPTYYGVLDVEEEAPLP